MLMGVARLGGAYTLAGVSRRGVGVGGRGVAWRGRGRSWRGVGGRWWAWRGVALAGVEGRRSRSGEWRGCWWALGRQRRCVGVRGGS
jgi:hypothetical protein